MAQRVKIHTVTTTIRVKKSETQKAPHPCPYCGGDGIIGNGKKKKRKS